MDYLSGEDFIKIKLASVLSDADRKALSCLYQPLLGSQSIALYFYLWSSHEASGESSFYSIEQLLLNLQMTTVELLRARQRLEALGLLRTYERTSAKHRLFTIVLHGPKQPNEFFNDPILKGMLIKYVTEDEVIRLIALNRNEINIEDSKEVSASIKDIFHPNLDDDSFLKLTSIPTLKGRKNGVIPYDFDYGVFFKICEEKQNIQESFFSKDELELIKKMACVYGVNEHVAAEAVIESLDFSASVGNRVNDVALSAYFRTYNDYPLLTKKKPNGAPKKRPTGTTYEKMYEAMEQIPPYKFLRYRQNDTPPSTADVALIERLATRYGLENGVINALIAYVLDVKNNTLPKAYIEKIASSLVREGVVSSVEAVNYLTKTYKSQTTKSKTTTGSHVKAEEDDDYVPQYKLNEDE